MRVERHRAIRPADPPGWRLRLLIWLHDFTHPWRPIDHHACPYRPGPLTSIETFPLERLSHDLNQHGHPDRESHHPDV